MFGLLYLLNHWCMLGIKEIPANKTCTSVPQEWHKPRGDSIEPEPVMKCSFSKASSDKDGKRKLHPVTSHKSHPAEKQFNTRGLSRS